MQANAAEDLELRACSRFHDAAVVEGGRERGGEVTRGKVEGWEELGEKEAWMGRGRCGEGFLV